MLIGLAGEIDRLQDRTSTTRITEDWETEFRAIESERRVRQTLDIKRALEAQATPIRQAHSTQLASVSRQNRELEDELQRTLDSIEKIERDTPDDWVKQAEAKPLSYRTLDRLGALSTDIKGVRALARIGGLAVSYHSKSARPLGAFPVHHTWSDPRNIESIKRAQQLLKEHSVHLIEVGLLQP